jgi:hypothetical protein
MTSNAGALPARRETRQPGSVAQKTGPPFPYSRASNMGGFTTQAITGTSSTDTGTGGHHLTLGHANGKGITSRWSIKIRK